MSLLLAIGHALGGPRPDRRAGLAVTCVARNSGLALFIAGSSEGGQRVLPGLLIWILLGAASAMPYSLWMKRRVARRYRVAARSSCPATRSESM